MPLPLTRPLLAWFLTVASCLAADVRAITVSTSRQVSLPSAQATIGISVSGPSATTVDQALATLSDLGITSQDFQGAAFSYSRPVVISTGTLTPQMTVTYQFTHVLALSDANAFLQKLLAKTAQLAQTGSPLTLSLTSLAAQTDPAQLEQVRTALLPEMMREARQRAQAIANEAGLILGDILEIQGSDAPSLPVLTAPVALITALPPPSLPRLQPNPTVLLDVTYATH